MAYYNPTREDNQKEPNKNWFIKTAVNTGILAGGGIIGYRFLKGPHGKALRQHINNNIQRLVDKDLSKEGYVSENLVADFDRMSDITGEPRTYMPEPLDNRKPDVINELISNYKRQSADLEMEIVGYLDPRGTTDYGKLPQIYGQHKSDIDLIKSALFTDLRQDTLKEYLNTDSAISRLGYEELIQTTNTVMDIRADNKDSVKFLNDQHDSYVSEEEYIRMYYQNLRKVARKLREGESTTVARQMSQPWKYRRQRMGRSPITEDPSKVSVNVISQMYDQKVRLPQAQYSDIKPDYKIDVHQMLAENRQLTASSGKKYGFNVLDNIHTDTNYNTRLKHLTDLLDKKVSENADPSLAMHGAGHKLVNYTAHIEGYKHASGRHTQKLVLQLFSANDKNPATLEVPISIDSRLPGSSIFATGKTDRTKVVRQTYGGVEENIELNTTNVAFDKLHRLLSGTFLQEFDNDPKTIESLWRRELNKIQETLPLANVEIRSVVAAMALEHTEDATVYHKKNFATNKQQINIARNSAQRLAKMASSDNALVLALDLEVLADNGISPTPQSMATYESAQIYKAAISVYDPTKAEQLDFEEISSNHINSYFRDRFTDDHREWFSKVTGIEDRNEAQAQFIKKLNEQANTGIKNNHDFVRQIKSYVNAIQKQHKNKDIYIMTKYGELFDLSIIDGIDPDFGQRLRGKHIDIHSLHAAREGAFSSQALQLSALVRAMLRGDSDPNWQDFDPERGPHTQKVIDKLTRSQKGLRLNKRTVQHWLKSGNSKVEAKIKQYLDGGAHANPFVDNMFGLALLTQEISRFHSGDNFYQNIGNLDYQIKMLGSPDMNRLYDISKKRMGHWVTGKGYELMDALTSGMAAKGYTSFVGTNDFLIASDVPRGKNYAQIYRAMPQFKKYDAAEQRELGFEKWTDYKSYKDNLVYNGGMNTTLVRAGENWVHGAHDMTNAFVHQVNMRTLYSYNSFFGLGGYVGVTEAGMKKINLYKEKSFTFAPANLTGNAYITQKLQSFEEETLRVAQRLANRRKDGKPYNTANFENAAKIVSRRWDKTGANIVKPGDYLGEVPGIGTINFDEPLTGRISFVKTEKGARDIPRTIAKLQMYASGKEQLGKVSAVMHGIGKATLSTMSDVMAFGIDTEVVTSADHLEKGYTGMARTTMLSRVVNHYRKIIFDKRSHSTDAEIQHAHKKLKSIAAELNTDAVNVHWDGREMIFDNQKLHTIQQGFLDGDPDIIKQRYLNVHLPYKKLQGWLQEVGDVWTQENIDLFHSTIGRDNIERHKIHLITEQTKDIKKMFADGAMAYNSMSNQQQSALINETSQIIQAELDPKPGQAIGLLHPYTNKLGQVVLGGMLDTPWGIYGAMNGLETKAASFKFKSQYFAQLLTPDQKFVRDNHFTDHLSNYFKKHRNRDVSLSLKDAYDTHTRWKAALLSREMAERGSLNIDQLTLLIDTEKTDEFRKEIKNIMQNDSLDFLQNRLAELNETAESKYQAHELIEDLTNRIRAIQDALDVKHQQGLAGLEKSHSLVKTVQANVLRKHGMERGFISLSAAPEALKKVTDGHKFVLNLGEEIKQLNKIAGVHIPESKIDAFLLGHKQKIDQMGSKASFDIDMENKTISMGSLVLPVYSKNSNIGGALSEEVTALSGSMQLNMQVADAYLQWYKSTEKYGLQDQRTQAAERLVKRQMFKVLFSDKSEFYDKYVLGNDMSIPAIYSKHKTIEPILTQAHSILERGGLQVGGKFKRYTSTQLSMVEKIAKSRMDTLMVTSSQFTENMNIVDDSGANIKFAKYMEDRFGKEYTKRFQSEVMTLPGWFSRFPISQSGKDGVIDTNITIIPDEMADDLGLDKNSIFLHWIMSKLEGADNDGDHGFYGIKNNAVYKAINRAGKDKNTIKREQEQLLSYFLADNNELFDATTASFGRFLGRKDIQDKIKKAKYFVHGNKSGQLTMARYQAHNGLPIFEKTSGLGVDFFNDFVKKTILGIAEADSGALTSQMIRHKQMSAPLASISQQMIGVVTNAVTARVNELWRNQGIAPADYQSIIGTLATGVSGISQSTISLAKHSFENQVARLATATGFLLNPDIAQHKEARTIIQEMWQDGLKEAGYSGQELNKQMENVDKFMNDARKSAWLKKTSPEYATLSSAFDDSQMHRATAGDIAMMESKIDISKIVSDVYQRRMDLAEFKIKDKTGLQSFMDLNDAVKTKFKLSPDFLAGSKKLGKYGVIGAGAFLALNFFRPFQLSNSFNPLDMFQDLGTLNGEQQSVRVGHELPNGIALDQINASFSKQAYVKLNEGNYSKYNKPKSVLIAQALNRERSIDYSDYRSLGAQPHTTYSNFTSYIGSLGANNYTIK